MVNKETSPSVAGGPVFGSTIWTLFWHSKLNKSAQAGAPLGCENMDVKVLVGRCPNDSENADFDTKFWRAFLQRIMSTWPCMRMII